MRNLMISALIILSAGACAATAAERSASPVTAAKSSEPNALTARSQNDFETTLTLLRSAIDSRGFKTFAVIDHAKGAASIDQALPPTTLVIFGNPKGGTPLMQADQRLGLELPLKMLVHESERGEVFITHASYGRIINDYGLTGQEARISAINGAMRAIILEATTAGDVDN